MNLSFEKSRLSLAEFPLELDLRIHGEVVGIYGPSGAGKTSMLDLLAGLRRPSQGRILFKNMVWTDVANGTHIPTRARSLGYVPQDGALFPHLPVVGNILYGVRDSAAARPHLEHVNEVLEIQNLMNRRVGEISGGQKQRVALARALMSKPALLLLDEPLAALDESLKEKSLELLRRVRTEFEIPMLYVSHAAEELVEMCDLVIVLEKGQIFTTGHPLEIFESSKRMRYQLKAIPTTS
jgi:molybdate transport system ATP-binding protein